jgi:hypothetical protein
MNKRNHGGFPHVSTKTRFATAVAALTFGLTVSGGVAYATSQGPRVVPGAPCETVGATGVKNGQFYRCEQRDGDPCPIWRWQYDASVPKSGRTSWSPGPCCASPKPSPSATPSTSSSPSTSSAPSGSSAAAGPTTASTTPILPITGLPIVGVALGALLLLGLGAALYAAGRRPRNS